MFITVLLFLAKADRKKIYLILPKEKQNENVILKNISVDAEIIGSLVETNYTLTYHHEELSTIYEAKLSLPFDTNVAVNDVSISYKNKTMIGKIQKKHDASQIYQAAKDNKDVALLIHREGDLLMVDLAGIGPNETFIVKIVTHSALEVKFEHKKEYYFARYIFPTSIVPRYNPSIKSDYPQSPNPPKLLMNVQYYFKFKLTALNGKIVGSDKNIYEYQGDVPNDIVIDIIRETTNAKPIVNVENYEQSTSTEIICSSNIIDNAYIGTSQKERERSYVFLIDRSGSMVGSSIQKAKEALILFLHSLQTQCKFEIIGFGSSYQQVFRQLVEYNEENLKKASEIVQNFDANMGGTNIYDPIRLIEEEYHPDNLILLTDGAVYNANQIIDYCSRFNTRVSTIGLGDAATYANFLQRLSKVTLGTSEIVHDINDLEGAVIRSLESALNGLMINSIQSNIGQICQRFPFMLPFSGDWNLRFYSQSLIDLNKLPGGILVEINGTNLKNKQNFNIIFKKEDLGGNIHIINNKKILHSISLIEANNNKMMDKNQIIQESIKLALLTEYTSFILVDDSDKDKDSIELKSVQIPTKRHDTRQMFDSFMHIQPSGLNLDPNDGYLECEQVHAAHPSPPEIKAKAGSSRKAKESRTGNARMKTDAGNLNQHQSQKQLIQMQKATGEWNLTAVLNHLSVQLDDEDQKKFAGKESLLSGLIALNCLDSQKTSSWHLVIEKGMNFLKAHYSDEEIQESRKIAMKYVTRANIKAIIN